MELQRLYVTLALDADDFKAGMATVTGVVAATAIAASAAVAAVAIDGVKAAKDMEEQMSGIAAIFSTTVDEIQPLGDLIKELGLNPNLKVNATEAADAIEMLGKNGLTMAEILEGAVESTVLLANSTGADFATAANIGTDAMALFKIEASDMIDAVDGITSVTVNSKFGINDYALALAQGGGVASAVGVTFQDFNATIAGISPLFKSGSDAGTSLKTMLMRLNPQTDKAADAMEQLGLLTAEGTSAFFDAQGNMKDMSEVAGLMQGAFGDLSEQQRLSTMQTIFGSDAMRAAVGMMELGEEGFKSLSDTMGQTDAMAAAATRMDNLSGAMEIFEGIVDTVKLSLGQALLPVIRMFVDWLIVLADTWMPKIETAFALFAETLTGFFANISEGMTVIDAFLLAIQQFIPPELYAKIIEIKDAIAELWAQIVAFLTPIWEAIAAFVSWKDVLIAVGIAITVTVVPIILGLIVALAQLMIPILAVIAVVALLRNAWETDFAGIRDFTAGIWEAIQQAFEAFKSLFQGDVDSFLEQIGQAWETGISALATFVGNLWTEVKPHLETFWINFKAWFAGIDWGLVGEMILKAIGAYIQLNANIIKWIISALIKLGDAIFEWAKTVDWEQVAVTIILAVSAGLDTFWANVRSDFEALWKAIKDWFEGVDWEELAINIMEAVAEGLSEFWDWVSGEFDELWEASKSWFESINWAALGISIAQGIANGIKEGAGKIADAAVAAAKAAFAKAMAWLRGNSPSERARDELGIIIPQGMALGIEAGTPAAEDAATSMAASVLGAASEGIVNGIGELMRAVNEIAGQLSNQKIKRFADAAISIFDMIGSAIAATRMLSKANFPEIVQGWHLKEQMVIFRRIVDTLMREFDEIAGEMEADHSKALKEYAKAANAIFDLIEDAIEGSRMLSGVDFADIVQGWHLRDQMIIFRNIVRTVMREFQLAAAEMAEGASKEVGDFAKAAQNLFELVEVAIAGAIKLSETDFSAIVQGMHLAEQITIFRRILATMLREFELAGDEFGADRINGIAGLAKNINEFIEHLGEIIDGIFATIDQLDRVINARPPAGLSKLMKDMNKVFLDAVLPAYNAGMAIGNALISGITDAINAGLVGIDTTVSGVGGSFTPAMAAAAPGVAGTDGRRTVILENGAFQVTINDGMDAEEFKQKTLDILRELTE